MHKEHKRNKGKQTKEWVMIKNAHRLKWLNSLKTIPNGVANCRNLPFRGRATRGSRVRLPRKENARSHHQSLFEENIRKTKKRSTNLKDKRFESCLRAGKVLAPHASTSRDGGLLSNVQNHDFHICLFSLFYVFIFLGSSRAGLSLLRILNRDEELRPT